MFENIKNKNNPLGVELVKTGLITETQLDDVLKFQKSHPEMKIGEIVDTQNLCDKNELLSVLSKKLGERAVKLDSTLDFDYKQYIPRDSVIANKAMPFALDGNTVKVAFSDPLNKEAVENVRLQILSKGFQMEKYITLHSMIMACVKKVKNVQDK